MPDFTCPHIDNVNDWLHKASIEMELLRTMNSQLRDNDIGKQVVKRCKR